MPNLVIRFIDEPGVISRLITWSTNSLWCHCEALSSDGQAWIGAHSGTGVDRRPLDWIQPRRERRYAIPVAEHDAQAAYRWLDVQLGRKYNYLDILGLALHKRTWSPQRAICSQLMLEFMQQAGLQPLNVLPGFDALTTPEMLHLSPLFIGRSVKPQSPSIQFAAHLVATAVTTPSSSPPREQIKKGL